MFIETGKCALWSSKEFKYYLLPACGIKQVLSMPHAFAMQGTNYNLLKQYGIMCTAVNRNLFKRCDMYH